MPCYQVRTTTVVFKAQHEQLLRSSIASTFTNAPVGSSGKLIQIWTGRNPININLDNETIEYQVRDEEKVNMLRREYSRQVIAAATKLKRWVHKKQSQRSGEIVRY